jgi:hypothetical protein
LKSEGANQGKKEGNSMDLIGARQDGAKIGQKHLKTPKMASRGLVMGIFAF